MATASYNSNTNAWQDLRSQYLNSDNATFSAIGWYNFSGLQFDWFSAFGCDVAPFTSIISNFLPSNSRKINLFRYDAFYFFKSRDPLSESPPGQSICLIKHSQWEFGTKSTWSFQGLISLVLAVCICNQKVNLWNNLIFWARIDSAVGHPKFDKKVNFSLRKRGSKTANKNSMRWLFVSWNSCTSNFCHFK